MKKLATISFLLIIVLNGLGQSVDTVRTENLRLTVLNNDWENARMFANGDTIPFDGVMVKYYPETNKIETIVQYKNGQTKNCWSKLYYQNGQIMQELWYGNQIGAEHGKYIFWFENGKVKITGQYENGAKQGKWISYSKDGQKESEQNYIDRKDSAKKNTLNMVGTAIYNNIDTATNYHIYIIVDNDTISNDFITEHKFNISLDLGQKYIFGFKKRGYQSKHLIVNIIDCGTFEDQKFGFEFSMELKLIEGNSNDESILVGKIGFNPSTGYIEAF